MRLYERRTERDRFHPLKEISRREREKKKIPALYNFTIFLANFRSNREFSGLDEFLLREVAFKYFI